MLRSTERSLLISAVAALASCSGGGAGDGGLDARVRRDLGFQCGSEGQTTCLGDDFVVCRMDNEFLYPETTSCAPMGKVCVNPLGCVTCRPGSAVCFMGNAALCADDGSSTTVTDVCDPMQGEVCYEGRCRDQCQLALDQRSYLGCEFWAADLDNASVSSGDASAQQFAVVVSNPGTLPVDVVVERSHSLYGQPASVREVESATVLPGDLEVFRLPRAELDGSSSNAACITDADCLGEVCVTDGRGRFCRVSQTARGTNDGTHSARTARGYRVRASLPVIAYQFNPLDNRRNVFSNDASLLLPTSAIDTRYTVVGWPQTIANALTSQPCGATADCITKCNVDTMRCAVGDASSDQVCSRDSDCLNTLRGSTCDMRQGYCTNPLYDFDSSSYDEDLRAVLTVVGTQPNTRVTVRLGSKTQPIVPVPGITQRYPGETIEAVLNPFEVLNLETSGYLADFTGSVVEASAPVSVFTNSEASDAPFVESLGDRLCCADHLEEQLIPDSTLGRHFSVALEPSRTLALNDAMLDYSVAAIAHEPTWIRVLAVAEGTTTLTTSLPMPEDFIALARGEDVVLRVTQDFLLDASGPVAVMQITGSQGATGVLDGALPVGDPSILLTPPIEQWRDEYVVLTPDKYLFDFLTIMADAGTTVTLDGQPLSATCTTSAADGRERRPGELPPDRVILRCQLGFPDILGRPREPGFAVQDGMQLDGVHVVRASAPIGLIITGFDDNVSYGYVGGLNLTRIN